MLLLAVHLPAAWALLMRASTECPTVLCAQYGVTRIVAGEMSGAAASSLVMDHMVACPAAWHKLMRAAPRSQAGTWSL